MGTDRRRQGGAGDRTPGVFEGVDTDVRGQVAQVAEVGLGGVASATAQAVLGLLFAPVRLTTVLLIAVEPRRRAIHGVPLRTVVRRTGA